MKKFKDFQVNENATPYSKRFQYTIDRNSIEDFEEDLDNIAPGMGIESWLIRKVDGVSTVNVFLQFYGDEQSVSNIIEWIKERY